MIYLDSYAYRSKFIREEPMSKLFFAALTMVVCLWANNIIISVVILLLMASAVIWGGGVNFSTYLKLLTIPMVFLLTGLVTITFSVSLDPRELIFFIPIKGVYGGISLKDLYAGSELFFKALGCLSCLYFLALSTPMEDLVTALGKLRVPKLLVEIMGLVYRFIFILLDTAETIFIAQSSRMGYSTIASGYRSLGSLASALFIRSFKRAEEVYTALESRGYEGELRVLHDCYERHWWSYMLPVAVNGIIIAAAILIKANLGD